MGSNTILCPNCGVPNWVGTDWCVKCDEKLPPYAPIATLPPVTKDELIKRHVIKY